MLVTLVQSLGWEDPLEKAVATHSSILPWRIPWTEKPGWFQSLGSQRVEHDCETNTLHVLNYILNAVHFSQFKFPRGNLTSHILICYHVTSQSMTSVPWDQVTLPGPVSHGAVGWEGGKNKMRLHRLDLQTVTPNGDDALRKAGNEADTMTDMSKHNYRLKDI